MRMRIVVDNEPGIGCPRCHPGDDVYGWLVRVGDGGCVFCENCRQFLFTLHGDFRPGIRLASIVPLSDVFPESGN